MKGPWAGQGRVREMKGRPVVSVNGQAGWQLGPVVYLSAVLSHGVVVETGLGLELLPAVLALEGILQLQTRDP